MLSLISSRALWEPPFYGTDLKTFGFQLEQSILIVETSTIL